MKKGQKTAEKKERITFKELIKRRRMEASALQVDEKVYFIAKYLGQFSKKSDEDAKKIIANFSSQNGKSLQMVFEYRYSGNKVFKRFIEINLRDTAQKINTTVYKNNGCVEINKLNPEIYKKLDELVAKADKIRVERKKIEIKSIRKFEIENKKSCDGLPQLLEDWLPLNG